MGENVTRRDFGRKSGRVALGLGGVLACGCAPGALSRRKNRPNIVLVTMDTQKRDRLGCYAYDRDTSPFVDSLAGQGTVFDSAYSQSCFTLTSIGSKMTSRYPRNDMPLGIHWGDFTGQSDMKDFVSLQKKSSRIAGFLADITSSNMPYEIEDSLRDSLYPKRNVLPEHRGGITLAEKLKSEGYQTLGAASMRQMKPTKGFARGFDRYSISKGIKRNGDLTVAEIKRFLMATEKRKPLFLWFHTFDVHGPFTAPEKYKDMFHTKRNFDNKEEKFAGFLFSKNRFVNLTEKEAFIHSDLYDGQIRFEDDNIKDLFVFMEKNGFFDRKRDIAVLSADHGEDIMTHGACGLHGTLYDTVTRVPLIFYGAGAPQNQRIDLLVANIDLAPTLVDMASGKIPEEWEGKSLLKALGGDRAKIHEYVFTDKPTLAETSVKMPGKSYFLSFKDNRFRSFDLIADPQEIANLGEDNRMHNLAVQYGLDEFNRIYKATKAASNLTEEEKERFKAMGYLDF